MKELAWQPRWIGGMLVLLLVFGLALWHAFGHIQQQISEANQQVAKNHARIAELEAWVRAQVAYTEQGGRNEAAQAMLPNTLQARQQNTLPTQTEQTAIKQNKR